MSNLTFISTVRINPKERVVVEVDPGDGGAPHEFVLNFKLDDEGVVATIDTGSQVPMKFPKNTVEVRSYA